MPTQTVEALVEGGKASAAPPLGPALGPLGVNVGQVVSEINKKTTLFAGMQVPVKVSVDTSTKAFTVAIGTPPSSALVKKEAGIEKGSSNPLMDKVADLRIEQIIKIAKMKESQLLGKGLKSKVKEVIGTCNSMGILVEGRPAFEVIKMIDQGNFTEEITQEKTELTAAELKELEEERKKLAEEIEKRRGEFLAKAKLIIDSMAGKARGEIKAKLVEAAIPTKIIEELLPVTAAAGAAGAPAEAGKAAAQPGAAQPAAAAKKEEKK
ncbi:50S ribosomal protein L11 [Candidatus Woesearchaeota archaeon]|nr:50S ribosomal protein L11 [Candidatus Woesearchaeota archaeon]